jgi:23S rRNA (cytidine1920-2'-O)/16S rRNA (cytidine1409-2'-O)-methyltransferase
MARIRLDSLLVERGLYPSRARAAAAVMAGRVHLQSGADRGPKPGQMVAPDVALAVEEGPRFVSRGGEKLDNALAVLPVAVEGRRALDVGASTGGFTDRLLQGGAEAVAAVDVGYGQLAWGLREDDRVTVIDRTNAKELSPEMLPFTPDLIVIDVSFISLAKVLPAVLACAAAEFDCLALVKPQFEVGKERVGKGGVVRSASDRRSALTAVGRFAQEAGHSVVGMASSGLPGPAGNRESFVWIAEGGRPGRVDPADAALEVEP